MAGFFLARGDEASLGRRLIAGLIFHKSPNRENPENALHFVCEIANTDAINFYSRAFHHALL
jgi:hypothetical protein